MPQNRSNQEQQTEPFTTPSSILKSVTFNKIKRIKSHQCKSENSHDIPSWFVPQFKSKIIFFLYDLQTHLNLHLSQPKDISLSFPLYDCLISISQLQNLVQRLPYALTKLSHLSYQILRQIHHHLMSHILYTNQ